MESNYSNRDFEQFVQQNADQYRMYPSERVWKGINSTLHTRRRWYGFWLTILLLATGGAVTWVMTTYPSNKKQDQSSIVNSAIPVKENSLKNISTTVSEKIENLLPFAQPYLAIPDEIVVNNDVPFAEIENLRPLTADEIIVNLPSVEDVAVAASTEKNYSSLINKMSPPAIISAGSFADNNELITSKLLAEEKLPVKVDNVKSGLTDQLFLLTIESVINSYKYQKPAKRVSWQLFVTPTVSYRKLSVNKDFDKPAPGVYPFANLADVNSVVTHKPDLGLQLGLSARYPITKNLKLRGGLQFNINRYDIKAYQFNGEVAQIDLNGNQGNINTWTYYRNYSGYKSDWLKNYYFSVSAPIGAEVKLIGNKKTNVGVAGTIQPTYILSDRAYLISTDYKNYAEVPRLIRHVNLNTSFETFVNYTSGKTKWQIGPQVRYQILSSFHNKYPVKENLFDFGLKVGLTLNE